MFNLPVTRSCGHKETVTITETLPPGKQFRVALAKIEKEESAKPCSKCQSNGDESQKVSVAQAVVTITIWSLILGTISVLFSLITGSY